MAQKIIDRFEVPDELAHELSDLITRQVIKERLLVQLVGEPDKYEIVEKDLIPIVEKVEAIKLNITRNLVPIKYRKPDYIWNFDGYEVDGNKFQIIQDVLEEK